MTQGGDDVGECESKGCTVLTIIINLPAYTETRLKHFFVGHAGVGVNGEFYDYGRGHKGNGEPWWDNSHNNDGSARNPNKAVERGGKGLTTEGAINVIKRLNKITDEDFFVIKTCICKEGADEVEAYWKKLYKNLGKYDNTKSNCTTHVRDSIAGMTKCIITKKKPFGLDFYPQGYLMDLKNFTHSCGSNQGKKVKIEHLENKALLK